MIVTLGYAEANAALAALYLAHARMVEECDEQYPDPDDRSLDAGAARHAVAVRRNAIVALQAAIAAEDTRAVMAWNAR